MKNINKSHRNDSVKTTNISIQYCCCLRGNKNFTTKTSFIFVNFTNKSKDAHLKKRNVQLQAGTTMQVKYTQLHAYIHTHIHMYRHVHICICASLCIIVYACLHTHKRVYVWEGWLPVFACVCACPRIVIIYRDYQSCYLT